MAEPGAQDDAQDDVGAKDFKLGAGVLGLLALLSIILMLVS